MPTLPGATPDPRERFSDRVEDYVRFRPNYPAAVFQFLADRAGLGPGCRVADVGAGTGIFTAQLLETGAAVRAVEPNDAMRAAAESSLGARPGFSSVRGSAEETGLPDRAVDLVTCAQAFHWFDVPRCRREFRRILTADGGCALVWNTGQADASEFSRGYEAIKQRTGEDFARVRHEGAVREARCDELYGRGHWEYRGFAHAQALDFPGLRGRLLSSSYAPKEGHPGHAPMMAALRELFERCQDAQGRVTMDYITEVYLGRPAGGSAV